MAADPSPPSRARARRRLRRLGVRVLHEDNHLLAVAKPAGLLSQGGPAGAPDLVGILQAYRKEAEEKPGRAFLGLVHRLDRNVSGVLVAAKTSKAARRLSALLRARAPALRKEYLAWVVGRPDVPEAALVDRVRRESGVTRVEDAGGREARLVFRVEGDGPRASRLRVLLQTGRTHQIRAQLAGRGHPLHGDGKYGGPPGARPALHAHRLVVPHPVGESPLEIVAPVPEDLLRLDARLRIRPPVDDPGRRGPRGRRRT